MSRTTLSIDPSILDEVRRIQKKERRSMGKIVSELLAEALGRRIESRRRTGLKWVSQPMKAMLDLEDKDALYTAMEEGPR